VELHDNVIIDDFTYISTGLKMEPYTTIESNSVLMGGKSHQITVKRYSAISTHCSLFCSTSDFSQSLFLINNPSYSMKTIEGNITLMEHCILGSHCTVLPGITLHEGVRIGAHSLINQDLDQWKLYAGVPIRFLKNVNREGILKNLEEFNYKNT